MCTRGENGAVTATEGRSAASVATTLAAAGLDLVVAFGGHGAADAAAVARTGLVLPDRLTDSVEVLLWAIRD